MKSHQTKKLLQSKGNNQQNEEPPLNLEDDSIFMLIKINYKRILKYKVCPGKIVREGLSMAHISPFLIYLTLHFLLPQHIPCPLLNLLHL